jgi:hypothetical protein
MALRQIFLVESGFEIKAARVVEGHGLEYWNLCFAVDHP